MANLPSRYQYYVGTGVYNDKKQWVGVCFAYKQTTAGKTQKDFYLVPQMSDENVEKYLALLQKGIKFSWEWDKVIWANPHSYVYPDAPQRGTEVKAVRFTFPRPEDYQHCMMFGNLCKGISEFAYITEQLLADETKESFFQKHWKHTKAAYAEFGSTVITYHNWWANLPTSVHQQKECPAETKKIRELFENLDTLKPGNGYVWKTCLKA